MDNDLMVKGGGKGELKQKQESPLKNVDPD
jgi:hypothetical protein